MEGFYEWYPVPQEPPSDKMMSDAALNERRELLADAAAIASDIRLYDVAAHFRSQLSAVENELRMRRNRKVMFAAGVIRRRNPHLWATR